MLFGKLGKQAPRIDPRTLQFSKYRRTGLTVPGPGPIQAPPSMGYTAKTEATFPSNPWPMFLNDQLGDCTIAAAGHMIGEWSADANKAYMPTDPQILAAYEDVGGYKPGDPSTDNGCVMLDVLNYWRKTGIAGHKIQAYVSIEPKSSAEISDAIYLFGNVYLGIQLPLSAQGAADWRVPANGDQPGTPGEAGSWGGHCVPIVGYSQSQGFMQPQPGPGGLTVVTWGGKLNMSWMFLETYADEAYAVLSPDWIESNGRAYNGFDLAQLETDLKAITA